MMNISKPQHDLLCSYNIRISDDINDVLLQLDAVITEIGFNKNYELTEVGLKLQELYDQLYEEN